MQKPKLIYDNGWEISIPCTGNCSQLFLEWLGEFQGRTKTTIDFKIKKMNTNPFKLDTDVFVIRFTFLSREFVRECFDYIINNL